MLSWKRILAAKVVFASLLAAADSPLADRFTNPPSAERGAMLTAACAGTRAASGNGCASCPSYLDSNVNEPFKLNGVLTGAFTTAGVNEAVLRFEGCEAHVNNFGGLVLLRNAGQGWKFIRYLAGINPEACQTPEVAGRQALLCVSSYTQSGENDTMLSLVDFQRKKPDRMFLMVRDTVQASCLMGGADYTTGSLQHVEVSGQIVKVTLTAAKRKFPAGVKRDACESFKVPMGQAYQLEYLLKNGGVELSPASAVSGKRIQAMFAE